MSSNADTKPVYLNHGLFSDDYLAHRLTEAGRYPEWEESVSEVYQEFLDLYERKKDVLGSLNESQTEDELLEPVLDLLGFHLVAQERNERGEIPDYALFGSEAEKDTALKNKGDFRRFYSQALALMEGKYWGRDLNVLLKGDSKDLVRYKSSPEMQIVGYLQTTGVSWGILTNGSEWRLYYGDVAGRTRRYYSVDFEQALESEEGFRRFYMFFRRDAFIPRGPESKCFLEQVLEGSNDYAVRVGKELKKVVFEDLFPGLAKGMLEDHERRLGLVVDEEALDKTYRGTLALLYRLLFLLYAEARDLLPAGDRRGYGSRGINHIKQEVAGWIDEDRVLPANSHSIWHDLQYLFELVDKGNPDLNVPAYNGGLFNDEGNHAFLRDHKISDRYMAPALDALARQMDEEAGQQRFVDYGFVGVRELGSVYEGLLEFSLEIAEEDLVVVRENKKEVYKSKASFSGKKHLGEIKKGEPYLVNDNSERKATGSYYTPDYIVDYIVENTLEPLVDERKEALRAKLNETGNAQHPPSGGKRTMDALETLLDVQVLDPAMGSGHFLVAAVDYLTDGFSEIITELEAEPVSEELEALRSQIKESVGEYGVEVSDEQLSDTSLLKRMVMKRCVYGVDLNEMAVELAKLSLWLDAFTVGAPLTFLDHHLKHGNSLIGSSVREVRRELEESMTLLGEPFAGLLSATSLMQEVGEEADVNLEGIEHSMNLYARAEKNLEPFKRIMDIWTSEHFGNKKARSFLSTATSSGASESLLRGDYEAAFTGQERETINTAIDLADEKHFFHWELEFPEVFYDGDREQKNPGFDAVIGNPPYDVLAVKELGEELKADLLYYRSNSSFSPALGGKLNYYKLFTGTFSHRARRNGRCGLIIPMSVIGDKSALDLRKYLLYDLQLETLDCFPQKDNPKDRVFEDAKLSTSIVIWSRQRPDSKFRIRTHRGRYIEERSTSSEVSYEDVQVFDPEDLNIPNLSQEELNIVLRIAESEYICQFHQYANVLQGEINLKIDEDYISTDPGEHKIIRGSQVSRYRVSETLSQGKPLFLSKDDYLAGEKPNSKAFAFQRPRIVLQRNTGVDDSRRIHSALLQRGLFTADSLNFLSPLTSEISLEFLLAVLNSNISEWRFRLSSTNNHVNAYEIERLPMPRLEFTASEEQRAVAREEIKEMYEERDYNALIDWANRTLAWTPESGHTGDVHNHIVHDLLAYLADQVTISMEECDELQRLWKEWVEAVVPKAEKLTKTFRETGWVEIGCEQGWPGVRDEFQKRKAIPDARTLQDLKRETEKALAELCPLLERIRNTDDLIDQIVYRLYGLTEDEIAIVEEGSRERN